MISSHHARPIILPTLSDGNRLLARVDFAYPVARLAIEADGYRYHSGEGAWRRDLARRNALAAQGWRVVHMTWDALEGRAAEVLSEIRRALG